MSQYHYSFDLSSVSAIENSSTVYFRLVDSSTTAIGGGTAYGSSGYVMLDNFQVSAEVIPEPSTILLLGIGMLSCVLAIRRRLP